jgi:hypothetical protein
VNASKSTQAYGSNPNSFFEHSLPHSYKAYKKGVETALATNKGGLQPQDLSRFTKDLNYIAKVVTHIKPLTLNKFPISLNRILNLTLNNENQKDGDTSNILDNSTYAACVNYHEAETCLTKFDVNFIFVNSFLEMHSIMPSQVMPDVYGNGDQSYAPNVGNGTLDKRIKSSLFYGFYLKIKTFKYNFVIEQKDENMDSDGIFINWGHQDSFTLTVRDGEEELYSLVATESRIRLEKARNNPHKIVKYPTYVWNHTDVKMYRE